MVFSQNKLASPRDTLKARVGDALVTINYGSPSVSARTIWGKLVPYGKVWRTGANEATVFESTHDLMIGDSLLKAGKYSLFSIPGQQEWIMIFNRNWKQWGAYEYDPKEDELRIKVTPQISDSIQERLQFRHEDKQIYLEWEKMRLGLPLGPLKN